MSNPFSYPAMRRPYEEALRDYEERSETLFTPDGSPHKNNATARAFWHGFEGTKPHWNDRSRSEPPFAYFQAGRYLARLYGPKDTPFILWDMQQNFRRAIEAYREGKLSLYDGPKKNTTSALSIAFWKGLDGERPYWTSQQRTTPEYAYYRAGRLILLRKYQ